jgi:polyphosphate kinase
MEQEQGISTPKNTTLRKQRKTSEGDIPPVLTEAAIESFEVAQAIDAAELSKTTAVLDIVNNVKTGDAETLAQTLETVLAGISPSEAMKLRHALLEQIHPVASKIKSDPDDVLADDWREGGYPYKNLMSRKNYEKTKYQLQVELLKLQAWVKESGQRVIILFEGRDAAGKGGTIKRMM